MKNQLNILIRTLFISSLVATNAFAQQILQKNEFKLGMWFDLAAPFTGCASSAGTGIVPVTTRTDGAGNPTSQLNQLASDGFNIVTDYKPDLNRSASEEYLTNYLQLIKNNNLQMMMFANHYYKPDASCNNSIPGTNVYNNSYDVSPYKNQGWYDCKVRPDWASIISNLASNSTYSNTIWAWHMSGEGSWYHWYNPTSSPLSHDNSSPGNCNIEVPPQNVNSAISDFRTMMTSAGIPNGKQKMVVSVANHWRSIHAGTTDEQGMYEPQQYINLSNQPEVIFEASYYNFPDDATWLSQNYSNISNNTQATSQHILSKFSNIDYAHNFNKNVHAEIDIDGSQPNLFHSNLSVPNANWLWSQTYGSIIHGANGVWFWDLGWMRGKTHTDSINDTYQNSSNADRYAYAYFPMYYQNFVHYLSLEMRYLIEKNLISTDPNTILYTKTNQSDPNCGVVPAATTYITGLPADKMSENYGLRYTVRTNGTETIIIITNPLNRTVNVPLDFSNLADPVIKSSTGVEFLFEQTAPTVTGCNSSTYKTNRNAGVNWTAGSLSWHPYQAYTTGKALTVAFGPMDTHILKFSSSPTTYRNGWVKEWSNFGSGKINGWDVRTGDKFMPGDFDGDGAEELLCISNLGSNEWATILKYKNDGTGAFNWQWYSSNYGNNKIGTWNIQAADKFIVGDFDGLPGDELFCIQSQSGTSWATLFTYNTSTNTWVCLWTNGATVPACNLHGPVNTISGWTLASDDKFVVGNFDADSKKELLCIQNANSNAYATIFNFDSNSWVWGWDNAGNGFIGGWGIKQMDQYINGDFNNDGKKDDVFCVQKGGNWASIYNNPAGTSGSSWNYIYSNSGTGSIAGWGIPVNTDDRIIGGNIDSDGKDELMFIQSCSNCGWANTQDLNSSNQLTWNWSNHDMPIPTDFIYDWKVSDATSANADYLFIKAKSSEPKYLMAFRKSSCNDFLVNMYKSTTGTNKRLTSWASEKIIDNNISIYPNPNNGQFNIKFDNLNTKTLKVEVFSLMGKLLQSFTIPVEDQNLINLKLENIVSGTYLLTLTDDSGVTLSKLISIINN